MFAEIFDATRDSLAAYQRAPPLSQKLTRAPPLSQKLTRAFALCGGGLACIIIPDVLAAFGIAVADWKNGIFTGYGAGLFGLGLGQLLFPMFFCRVPQDRQRQQEKTSPEADVEKRQSDQHRAESQNLEP